MGAAVANVPSAAETVQVLTYFLAMLFSLSIHEAAHAWLAFVRGDMTAKAAGRLTLNPLAHIDPVGTVVLPLLAAFMHLPLIGWAKPVPVNLRNVKHPRWDDLLIAAAGPVANLLLAFVSAAALAAYAKFAVTTEPAGRFIQPFLDLAAATVWVNALLAVFNLIPLPPLDGAAVFGALLPRRMAIAYDKAIRPNGYILLFMIIIAGGLHWVPKAAGHYVAMVQAVVSTLF
jgi:Zn-dependent protease